MPLELTIVTDERRLNLEGVRQVVLPTPRGELGILPGHAPLVSLVTGGVMKVFPAAAGNWDSPGPRLYAVARGLARVFADRVVLLLADALEEGEIDGGEAMARYREETAMIGARHVPFSPAQREEMNEVAEFMAAQLEVLDVLRRGIPRR